MTALASHLTGIWPEYAKIEYLDRLKINASQLHDKRPDINIPSRLGAEKMGKKAAIAAEGTGSIIAFANN